MSPAELTLITVGKTSGERNGREVKSTMLQISPDADEADDLFWCCERKKEINIVFLR